MAVRCGVSLVTGKEKGGVREVCNTTEMLCDGGGGKGLTGDGEELLLQHYSKQRGESVNMTSSRPRGGGGGHQK
jgi:hypothetical protein